MQCKEPGESRVEQSEKSLSRFYKLISGVRSYHILRQKINENELNGRAQLETILSNTLVLTSKNLYSEKLRNHTIQHEDVISILYKNIIQCMSKLDNSNRYGCENENFRYLTEKQLLTMVIPNLYDILNLAKSKTEEIIRVNRPFGYSDLPHGCDISEHLNNKAVKGLVLSALINNSDLIKNIKIQDHGNYDYVGAFLKKGKKVIIRPVTGQNAGYKREAGSFVYTQSLIREGEPRNLFRILQDNFVYFYRRAAANIVKYGAAVIGGMSAYPVLVAARILPASLPHNVMEQIINCNSQICPNFYNLYMLYIFGTIINTAVGSIAVTSFAGAFYNSIKYSVREYSEQKIK